MKIYYETKPDELMHYGVLGMKWGHRRANKYANKATLARESAKEWQQIADHKAKKALAKGKKAKALKIRDKYKKNIENDLADAKKYEKKSKAIKNKHIQLAGGKKAYDYTTKESLGKALAKSALMGTYGALKYNQARANNVSRGKSAVNGIVSNSINNSTGGIVSVIEPRWKGNTKRKKKK